MSKYESAIKSAIDAQERQVCLDLLRSSPELTLGEIHKLSRGSIGRHFGSITVGELLGGSPQTGGTRSQQRDPAVEGAAPAAVNTRTAAGRQAYDDAMLFVRVDWDRYGKREVARSRRIPRRSTLVLLKGDQELGRLVAETREARIRELMDKGLAANT